MPVARYFAYTGSVLLALLFLLDWYLPSPAIEPARADIDRSIIRLQSRHKWPSAIAFDTSQPAMSHHRRLSPKRRRLPDAAGSVAMVRQRPSPVIAAAPQAAPKRVVRRAKVARTPA